MTALDANLLGAAVARFPEDALTPVRTAALQRFNQTGFPTLGNEDWRYTNLSAITELSAQWLETGAAASGRRTRNVPDDVDVSWLDLGALDDLPDIPGLHLSRLSDGIDGHDFITDDGLSSFNAALLRDGLYLAIEPGATIGKPIGLLVAPSGPVSQARVIVDIGRGAHVQLVEYHGAAGSQPQFSNSIVQLELAPEARVDYLRLQSLGAAQLQVGRLAARLERDTVLNVATCDFGGKLTRNEIVADIVGRGASVRLNGLYLASDGQHIDNHTRVEHRVGPATSDEIYRGILNGRSRCVFNGKAIVHPGADGTDANQANHNLLLSDKAEIDTKPELEIYADDVKCSHGATVGELNDEALFYLRSRGLDRDEAAHVLMTAFATSVVEALPIDALRAHVSGAMTRKLESMMDPGNRA